MQNKPGFVQATAKLKNCHMSARKMRLSADLVRGVSATKALGILRFTRKEGSRWLDKVLLSAIANWGVLTGQEPDEFDLVVKAIWVDQGAQLKRFQPAPHGRAHRIRKHSCHVTMVLENRIVLPTSEVEVVEAEEIKGND